MRELTILLDADKKTPLYEQIYEYIRSEIRGGRMECGVKLPSARSLAGCLQVSRSTVDLAYAKLQDEGYISPVPSPLHGFLQILPFSFVLQLPVL